MFAESSPRQVIIAVGDRRVRDALVQSIALSDLDLVPVGGREALRAAAGQNPAVIVVDPFSFESPATDLIGELRCVAGESPIMAIVAGGQKRYADGLLRAGASAVIDLDAVQQELPLRLAEALRGREWRVEGRRRIRRDVRPHIDKEARSMGVSKRASTAPEVTRRTFLKGSAVGAAGVTAAVALPGSGGTVLHALEAADGAQASGEQQFDVVCAPNCWMGCRLTAHVRDGKLVKTSMNPMPEERYNRVCLRGLSHVQRVYDPDRFKYPMKRVGPRGGGQWERISWEEAISTIASEMNRVRENYGSKAVAFMPMSGSYGVINGGMAGAIQRFASLVEGTVVTGAIDSAMPLGLVQVLGNVLSGSAGFGIGNEAADMAFSRLIILWGSNITESQIHNWHFIADAMEDNGAELVVIDPTFTATASKADVWIRPRPGSDPALALSIIHTIIEEQLWDQEFVTAHTVAPFLVSSETGLFVREDPADPTSRQLVWDGSRRRAVPFDEASAPDLFGEFEHDGVTVRPAMQLLADEAAKFVPETGGVNNTDVPADQIRELARLYATRKPAFIYPGFGIDRYTNGHLTGRGLATMAALTGNVGVAGATPAGAMGGGALMALFDPANVMGWLFPAGTFYGSMNYLLLYDAITRGEVEMYVPADPMNGLAGTTTPEPQTVPYPIKAAFINTSNFISNFPNQNKIEQELFSEENLEFVAIAEIRPTDTTAYADIILPITHWFENDDLVGGIHPFLMRSEKALEAPFEAKSDLDIFTLLAEEMGYGEFFTKSSKEYAEDIVAELAANLGEGGEHALKTYRDTGAVRLFPYPFHSFGDKVFYTPSGRCEFYAEWETLNWPATSPATVLHVPMGGNPLPHFEPPFEAWPENPLFEKYPLVNYQEHSRWRVHSQWFQVPWLRELDPEPVVKLHPEDAESRGLATGDYAEVFNDRGRGVFKVIVSEGILQGMCNTPKGWQRYQHKEGGYQELTADHKHPITLNCSFFDTLVEVRKA